ncbi:MAG: hypothetical protein KBA70_11550, partial [Aquabacterium sp.]|uniref:hypothetical protein n=1 Tax=Aquabacterium sp. TaxID=1872578 RepID=UPI001B42F119
MKLELSGVRVRLWLATALPAMLVIALLVVGFASQYGARMSEALKDRGVASARQLGSAAEFSLFAGDSETLDRLADAALRSDVQLRGVKIYSPQGQLRARAGQMRAAVPRLDGALQVVQSERSLVVAQPIYSTVSLPVDDIYAPVPDVSADMRATEARLLGYAVVEMSMQSLAQQRRDLLIWSLATAVGGLMLAGVMASVLSDLVSAQIGRINRVVQAVGEGQLGERVDMAQIGIMRPLAEGINAMVA